MADLFDSQNHFPLSLASAALSRLPGATGLYMVSEIELSLAVYQSRWTLVART